MELQNQAIRKAETQETETKNWHCDIYCRKIRHTTCEGEKFVRRDAQELCPYFDEMLY